MRWVTRIAIVIISLYVIGCGILYAVQENFIFKPSPMGASAGFNFGDEVWISVANDIRLHGLFYREENSRGVLLYWHGNRGNVRWCQRQAKMFAGLGYDILMVDYRGYGLSEGQIESSDQLYTDIQQVYDYLKQWYSDSQIVVVGYSLGTGMASYLAANNSPKGLVLVAPFVSITDMKDRYLPIVPDALVRFPLDNFDHLSRTSSPVIIFHGTDDEVIPYECSVRLQAAYADKVTLVRLPGTGHRQAIFHSSIIDEMKDFLKDGQL